VAPLIIVWIAGRFGWRWAFVLPSSLGLLWVIPWLLYYRDREPRKKALAAPLAPLLRLRPVWGMMLARMLSGPVVHFYWYWLPEYLKRERHFSMEGIGRLAGIPFIFAGLGNIAGGWLSGFLISRGYTADRARKTAFVASAVLCFMSILVPLVPGEALPIAVISVASFGVSTFVATHIGTLTDLFSPNVLARVAGVTGVGEGIMNMTFMLATGIVVDRFRYLPVFVAAGILPALGVASIFLLVRRIRLVA
jgi:ACS family hexuronate transporter-like MFS transporter